MKVKQREVVLEGMPISHGVAMGNLVFFTHQADKIPEIPVTEDGIENEVLRYRRALIHSKQDLKRLKKQLEIDGSKEAADILDSHIQMMEDPLLTQNIEDRIYATSRNAEFVFHSFIDEYQRRFNQIDDPFFKERGRDLLDIARRLLKTLLNAGRFSLAQMPPETVVFAHDLAASDVAEARPSSVCAFITEQGGTTSHPSIVAKAKGIPYVANIDYKKIEEALNTLVIVDGRAGRVILYPNKATIQKYRKIKEQQVAFFNMLEETTQVESETTDGEKIKLSANIEMINEVDLLHQYGGCGVGLFRSEYIFLSKQNFPSEEEQYIIYRSIIERMQGLPIVIRTFDVGGDKLTHEQQMSHQGNPYLGCRAIRFLLKERAIFRTQLKAILRASEHGKVSVMFPMVSGLPELLEAKKVLEEARLELVDEGRFSGNLQKIGSMIEVPSAAMIADILGKECDFLSIGTNDLVQYSLAVDRGNQIINLLYTPMHPGVIRLIKTVIDLAKKEKIPVSICGEIAADPRFTPLLIGLGIRELSLALRHLPWIKKVVRSMSLKEAKALAEKILNMGTAAEIQKALTDFLIKNLSEEYLHLSPFDLVDDERERVEVWEE